MIQEAILFIAGFFIVTLSVVLMAIRYKLVMGSIKEHITFLKSFYALVIAQLMNYLVPLKLGTVLARPVATKTLAGIPARKAFLGTMFEQIFDIGHQLLMLPFLILLIGDRTLISIDIELLLIVLFFASLAVVIKKREWIVSALWKMKRIAPKKLKKRMKSEFSEEGTKEMMNEAVSYLSDFRVLLKLSLPTIGVILSLPVALMLSGQIMGISIGFVTALLVHWTSYITGRISGLPGGLGVKDATLVGLLVVFGIDPAVSVAITLIYRAMAILPVVVLGAPVSALSGKSAFRQIRGK